MLKNCRSQTFVMCLAMFSGTIGVTPQQADAFWFFCDLKKAFDDGVKANQDRTKALSDTAKGDAAAGERAYNSYRNNLNSSLNNAREAAQKAPGTSLTGPATPKKVKKGILDSIKEFFGIAYRSGSTIPPDPNTPLDVFQSSGPVFEASPVAQLVNVMPPDDVLLSDAITMHTRVVYPEDYDYSEGAPPVGFESVSPAVMIAGTFNGFTLAEFPVFDYGSGEPGIYTPEHAFVDLLDYPEGGAILVPGGVLSEQDALEMDIPESVNLGNQFLAITNLTVDPVSGNLSGSYVTGTVSELELDLSNPADLNGDGAVDAMDASLLFTDWGASPGSAADITRDGFVDSADAGIVFSNWTGDRVPTQAVPEPTSGLLSLGALATLLVRRITQHQKGTEGFLGQCR